MSTDFETLKKQLKKRLTDDESDKVIKNLELIFRNRKIRKRFDELKKLYGSKKAILICSDEFYLSEKSIEYVVYGNSG